MKRVWQDYREALLASLVALLALGGASIYYPQAHAHTHTPTEINALFERDMRGEIHLTDAQVSTLIRERDGR